jgi:hypothetical protein
MSNNVTKHYYDVAALARQQQWQIPLVIRFIVTIQPR